MSPSCEKFTGYKPEEFVKNPKLLSQIVHPEDRALFDSHFELVSSDNGHEIDFRIISQDGIIHWVSHVCQPVFDEEGKWIGRRVSNREITKRKRAEEALKESEERLNRSQEIAHLGSWELDLKENKLTWSDEVYRIFGLKPQEFGATYEAFLAAVHPDDRASVDAAYSGSLKEGKDGYEIEHRVVRKDNGELRFVHEKCTHIRDKSGQIVKSLGMVHDITERKKVEQALKESEERFRLKLDSVLSPDVELQDQELANVIDAPAIQAMMDDLYNTTKIGFAIIDLQGKVLVGTGWQEICTKFHRVNPETLKNCLESDLKLTQGLEPGEFRTYKCKNNMWDIVTPLFIGGKQVGNVFTGQFFFEGEDIDREVFVKQAEKFGFDKKAYLCALDKAPRWNKETVLHLMTFYAKLSEMISKLSFSNLKLAKSLIAQQTMQERLEEKATEVNEYANQMEQLAEERAAKLRDSERLAAIGATAGMVGHDIRNPLQAITGDLFLAKSELADLPDNEQKQNALESLDEIENNVDYINKIVADLQDYARPLNPRAQETNIKSLFNEIVTKNGIPKNIKLTIEVEDKAERIMADPDYLKRIVSNLTLNAAQAMPNGGKLTIRAFADKKTNDVLITVKDTGVGIPEDVKPKLFTPMMTTKSKGQGFGLAVVKRMTEGLGGTVTFESHEGKGTTFIVRLPPQKVKR